MPPLAFTSSRQNSEPCSCATESTLSGPVCDTVMPMVMVSSAAATAGSAAKAAMAETIQNLGMLLLLRRETEEYSRPRLTRDLRDADARGGGHRGPLLL